MAKVVSIEAPKINRTAWLGLLIGGVLIALSGGFILFYLNFVDEGVNFIWLLLMAVGGWLFVSGLINFFRTFGIRDDKKRRNYTLLSSILNMIMGGLAIWLPIRLDLEFWVWLLYLIVIQTIISGVLEVLIGLRLRTTNSPSSGAFFRAIIAFVIAVVLILAPEFIGPLLIDWIGWLIAGLGVLMMAYSFRFRSRSQNKIAFA